MTVSTMQEQIEADIMILLMRALFDKEVAAFGDDGLGKYGRSDRAHRFIIDDITVDVALDEINGMCSAMVNLYPAGYSSSTVGHIVTDQNFLISVRQHLADDAIDPACIQYHDPDFQGANFVMMEIDVAKLLDWA